MIDKQTFTAGMGVLAGNFGREVDGAVSRSYYVMLSPRLTAKQFEAAVQRCIAEEKFWPGVAVILEKAGADAESQALSAFEHVKQTLFEHGGFRFLPHEKFQEFDLPTKAAIKAVGGLAELSNTPENRYAGMVKRFTKAHIETNNPQPALPAGEKSDPRVNQLVNQTARQLSLVGGRDRAIPEGDR
jgi:hypothetical protein